MKQFFYTIKPLVLVSLLILLGVFTQCTQQEPAQNASSSTATATTTVAPVAATTAAATTTVAPVAATTAAATSVPPSVNQAALASKPGAKAAKKATATTAVAMLAANDLSSSSHTNDDRDEEAEEEREREQKKNSYAEFLKREFEMTKDPATGKVPKMAAFEALEAAKQAKEFMLPQNARGANVDGKEAIPTVTVTPRGPFNFGGRVRSVGVDRRNNNILIAGGVSGSIMRSVNGGDTWTNVHPAGIHHSVNAVVQHPHVTSGDIWYVGTGEPGSSASASGAAYHGNGILKSTDNGLTWAAIVLTQGVLESYDNGFEAVSKIVVDAASGRIYVALLDAIYVSDNMEGSWTKMLGNDNSSSGYSDIIKTSNGTYYAAVRGNGIWKSNVADPTIEAHWTKIAGTGATNTLATGFERIVLASSPNNPNLVYALYNATEFTCPNTEKSQAKLEVYNAAGAGTWTDLTNNVGNCASIAGTKVISPQGGYNLAIAVKPDNASLVYLGGTEIYRYNTADNNYVFIGGDQGSPSGTNLHVDVHSLYFSNNTTLWSTNDGGVHKTDVTGTPAAAPQGLSWERKTTGFNGYQFYRADISPTNGSGFVGGGAQDNANMVIPNGTTDGIEVGGGDGAQHAIISQSGSDYNVLTSTQNGSLTRRTQAGLQGGIKPTGQTGEFVTGFLVDKDNTDFLYFPSFNTGSSGRKLFRSRTASTLTSGDITGDPTTGYQELTGVQSAAGTIIRSLASSYNAAYAGAAYSASNANRKLYFATSDALFRLNDPAFCDASTAPVNLNAPGTGVISDIAVNPINDNELLLTYSNYNTVSIYHTTNANDAMPTWTAVEGNATSAVGKASVRSALIVRSGTQTLYFVGTSTGLYATDALSGGTTAWEKVGGTTDKINFAPCVSMRLRTSDNNFVVGTHGSGLFQLSVPAAVLPIELTSFTGKAVDKTNVLSWETATEINNKGFDIERSADGSRFEKIGFVMGNGTSTKSQSYSFEDNTPLSISYYRLKQWDNDGRFELSKVIQITQKRSVKLTVYPNPVSNILTVETEAKGDYQIINLIGQTVLRGQISTPNIDVSALPQGTYMLVVGTEQVKFTKQ